MPFTALGLAAKFVSEPISGSFMFTPQKTGIKIKLDLKKSNATSVNNYHIHDGYCNNNPKHWDNKNVKVEGKEYKCVATDFETCESGDLAGKFGPLKDGEVKFHYLDPTVKFEDLLNKELSIVVHKAGSKDFMACADIKKVIKFGWF